MTTAEQDVSRRVLVVDDEPTICHVLRDLLESEECQVETAGSAEEALERLDKQQFDLAILDVVLPGIGGLELLERLRHETPDVEVVIMTSHATVERAVSAIRLGAYDLIQKPFDDLETVWNTARRALEKRHLERWNRQLLADQRARGDALARAVARLSALIDAGRSMARFDSMEALLGHFTDQVCNQLDIERASLMLVDEAQESLRIVASRGLAELDVEAVRVTIGEGIAGSVAATGEPILVTDASTDERLATTRSDLANGFISAPIVLSMPIMTRRDVLGVINLTNRRSGEPFTDEDLAFVEGLCAQLAVAIERTRHFERLKRACQSLKSAQEQLVFSERMKTAGQMAAGVAHDFNNVLSVILGRSEFILRNLQSRPPDLEKLESDTNAIRTISLHGAEIIKRIQDYTRIRKDAPRSSVDLNAVIKDAVELTRPKWKEGPEARGRHVHIRFDLGSIPAVSGQVYELTQVIGNLLFNAVDAMPTGGEITFKTWSEHGDVLLEVADSGTGMPEETRRRVFEPFFTTKSAGQGLGMSIIYGIISRHRGEISVESEIGRGTTFTIRMPASACDEFSESPQGEWTAPVGSARILLVEDEHAVRDVLAEALATAGHQVVAAADGLAGAEKIEQQAFDLVITDLSMPGMSGTDLARAVKKATPETPVILLSGWVIQEEQESVREAGVDHVLIKPCSIFQLLSTVEQALAQPIEA